MWESNLQFSHWVGSLSEIAVNFKLDKNNFSNAIIYLNGKPYGDPEVLLTLDDYLIWALEGLAEAEALRESDEMPLWQGDLEKWWHQFNQALVLSPCLENYFCHSNPFIDYFDKVAFRSESKILFFWRVRPLSSPDLCRSLWRLSKLSPDGFMVEMDAIHFGEKIAEIKFCLAAKMKELRGSVHGNVDPGTHPGKGFRPERGSK